MSNYPVSLDDSSIFPTYTPTTPRAGGGNGTHSVYHGNMNDAIKALQAKVGIDDSTVGISFDSLFKYDVTTRRPVTGINSDSDEFDGSTITGYSWIRQSSATYTVTNGLLHLSVPYAGSTVYPLLVKSLPGGTSWRFETKVTYPHAFDGYTGGGLALRESGTDKWQAFTGIFSLNNSTSYASIISQWTGTSQSSDLYAQDIRSFDNPYYMAIESSGTNLYYEVSLTGLAGTWHRIATNTITTYFTTAPDQIGFVIAKFNGTSGNPLFYPKMSVYYLRRKS